MSKAYLIPGLGADSRAYSNIVIEDHEVIKLDWIEPDETDTLKTYAQKLILHYDMSPLSIVIGNSLGGMLAMEMSKILPLKKTILISSIKTIDEAPGYFSFFKYTGIYKLVPGKLLTKFGFLIRYIFGKMKKEQEELFIDMLQRSSPTFIKWAMRAVLYFDNKIVLPDTYTITGDKDRVFNYKRIKNAIVIPGGTHLMIFDRADEINAILKNILAE
ncbi:MAG: alpha/beta fold hydrolase [Mucilaginibacter sp.]